MVFLLVPGLRLRGLLPQVLGRLHVGRVVGPEKHREAGAHAGPAGARHLGGSGRLCEFSLATFFPTDLCACLRGDGSGDIVRSGEYAEGSCGGEMLWRCLCVVWRTGIENVLGRLVSVASLDPYSRCERDFIVVV